MSEQEEHKTFRMLKRGKRRVDFTENIIPVFTDSNECRDVWGIWKASKSGNFKNPGTSGGSHNGVPYKVFDNDTSTGMQQWGNYSSNYVIIACPDGVAICPKQMQIVGSGQFCTLEFQGYNPDTAKWETLIGSGSYGLGNWKYTITNAQPTCNTTKFFTQFRLYSYADGTTSKQSVFKEFKIIAGTIKHL